MTPGNTEMMSEFCWSRLKVVDVAPAVWMSTYSPKCQLFLVT